MGRVAELGSLAVNPSMHATPVFLSDFFGDILVRCPRCAACAHLLPILRNERSEGYRLICSACCNERVWTAGTAWEPGEGPRLRGYDLDLWLTILCRGETLWAYNREHLDFLEQYISSTLRLRPDGCNTSLQSRLPHWILSSKNRDDVVKAIGRLRSNLPANQPDAVNPAVTSRLHSGYNWRGVADPER